MDNTRGRSSLRQLVLTSCLPFFSRFVILNSEPMNLAQREGPPLARALSARSAGGYRAPAGGRNDEPNCAQQRCRTCGAINGVKYVRESQLVRGQEPKPAEEDQTNQQDCQEDSSASWIPSIKANPKRYANQQDGHENSSG